MFANGIDFVHEFFKFDNDQAITDSSNFERIKIYSERNNDIIVADDKSVHVADIDLDGEYEFIILYMETFWRFFFVGGNFHKIQYENNDHHYKVDIYISLQSLVYQNI